jgi:hypothetical protein
MYKVENVARAATEAVKADHDDLVAFANEFHYQRKFVAALPAFTGNFFGSYNDTPRIPKSSLLYTGILVVR